MKLPIAQAVRTAFPEGDRIRSLVNEAERRLRALPQVEMRVVHHFSDGLYARELHIPKGTVLTGKIHKYRNLNIMSAGELSVLTEEGVKRVKAPFTIVSPPGTKRIAYAHEDTIWTTIHATEETDLARIEDHFTASSDQEYLDFLRLVEKEKAPCLGPSQQ